jgi:pilus assembly protein CpaB
MKRRILAVLCAFVLAVVGSLAIVAYVRAADDRAVAGREAAWVLVATQRIPAGTTAARVRADALVERIVMPAGTVPADALTTLDASLDGLAVTADIQPRQLLLRGMFDEPAQVRGGLSLPAGKVAISVEMTAAGRVAGFVRPGSTVAVFDTFTVQEGSGRIPAGDGLASRHDYNHATRVLLPRVEVIAVGERGTADVATSAPTGAATSGAAAGGTTGGTAKGGATVLVTVAVTQAEAERLIHATQTGTLYLALLDETSAIEPGAGVDNNSLFPE